MFVFHFQLPSTEFKNDKMKHNNTLNPTCQIGSECLWHMERPRRDPTPPPTTPAPPPHTHTLLTGLTVLRCFLSGCAYSVFILDTTNAVGDSHCGYKQLRHGNTDGKKTRNSSSILILFGMLFCTFYVKCISFNRCMWVTRRFGTKPFRPLDVSVPRRFGPRRFGPRRFGTKLA